MYALSIIGIEYSKKSNISIKGVVIVGMSVLRLTIAGSYAGRRGDIVERMWSRTGKECGKRRRATYRRL
jgi:hypothetical protein